MQDHRERLDTFKTMTFKQPLLVKNVDVVLKEIQYSFFGMFRYLHHW